MDIWRSANGAPVIRIAKDQAPGTEYVDYTPASGVDYAYQIRVFGSNGVSAVSALTSELIHVNPNTFGGFNDGY